MSVEPRVKQESRDWLPHLWRVPCRIHYLRQRRDTPPVYHVVGCWLFHGPANMKPIAQQAPTSIMQANRQSPFNDALRGVPFHGINTAR